MISCCMMKMVIHTQHQRGDRRVIYYQFAGNTAAFGLDKTSAHSLLVTKQLLRPDILQKKNRGLLNKLFVLRQSCIWLRENAYLQFLMVFTGTQRHGQC